MKRASFLEHVGWTGSGIVFTASALGTFATGAAAMAAGTLSFVQISDSHIGFDKPANPDVAATLEHAVDAINALPTQPAFVIHTGDISHLSKPAQFDTAKQILGRLKAPLMTIPGEHDMIDRGASYTAAFSTASPAGHWYAWDQGGVHFVALLNVASEEMGKLGAEQLAWLKNDLASRSVDTPIVVFAHVPLFALYPQWGWSTDDGAQAIAMLARFNAVTVLNGHIHQVVEHREGNIRFMTADSTAYPQPKAGEAAAPGPLKVPPDHLLASLGYRSVQYTGAPGPRITDAPLG